MSQPSPPPLSYNAQGPFPDWAAAVDHEPWEEWKSDSDHPVLLGWRKRLRCPICEHKISVYQEIVQYVDTPEISDAGVVAQCNCGCAHDGRPDSESIKGCGAYGEIGGPS